jgi:hypothetical protein
VDFDGGWKDWFRWWLRRGIPMAMREKEYHWPSANEYCMFVLRNDWDRPRRDMTASQKEMTTSQIDIIGTQKRMHWHRVHPVLKSRIDDMTVPNSHFRYVMWKTNDTMILNAETSYSHFCGRT